MPFNGDPHPLPGDLVPDNHNFVLPPYTALGWNENPIAPPPPADQQGWGNAVWGEDDEVQQQDQVPPEQDQQSMVLDNSGIFESDSHGSMNHGDPDAVIDVDMHVNLEEANVEDYNNLAIVPYVPPVLQPVQPVVALPAVPFGPPLPPEMIWRRSFETLIDAGIFAPKPNPMHMQLHLKRSWDDAFLLGFPTPLQLTFDVDLLDSVGPPKFSVHRPVARALFKSSVKSTESVVSSSVHTDEQFSFSAQQTKKTTKRKKALVPVVDTTVRRCTRGSIKRDGYKPILQELPMAQPKKKKPRSKPMGEERQSAAQVPHMEEKSGSDRQLPPETPVKVIQKIGAELEIAPEKLTVELLMADPVVQTSSSVPNE